MAPEATRQLVPLGEQLFREGYRFDFFQAVRLLERLFYERSRQDARWQRHAVGLDPPKTRDEIVRFRATPSLGFPAASVSQVKRAAQPPAVEEWELPPPELFVACMGLTGPSGVLPQHYTALVLSRLKEKDHALCDFLDMFNHRLVSLFYRAWEKYRFPIALERTRLYAGVEDDLFTQCVYCLVGLGTAHLRGRLEFDDEPFLFYAGHFAHFPRAAVSLERLLADYFDLPIRVEQFEGQWLYLAAEDRSCLPSPRHPEGLNSQLGVNLVAGARVWDVQSKFRLRLGPLGYRQFCSFMPTGDGLRPMCQMTRSYAGPEFSFDVQPVLRGDEVPWCQLGAAGAEAPRLGWNTWVRAKPFEHDVDDAVFFLDDV